MAEHRERVVGFEMEYSPSLHYVEEAGRTVEVRAVNLTERIERRFRADDSGFLGNGFRCYTDGELTEICTAETLPHQVGILQLESEAMALQALQEHKKQKKELEQNSRVADVQHTLPLRVSNDVDTGGFHENYQAASQHALKTDNIAKLLSRFAASAGVWTGQGLVSGETGTFQTTQKAGLNNRGASELVATWNLGEGTATGRYEFRYLNYPTLYWQLQHRAPYISALIRTLESGPGVEALESNVDVTLEELHAEAVMTALSPVQALVTDPKMRTAMQFQYDIADEVLQVATAQSYPDYEVEAAAEVAAMLQDMLDDNVNALSFKVPWVFKRLAVRDGWDTLDYIGLDASLHERAHELCLMSDSLGNGTVLAAIRQRDGRYTNGQVAQSAKMKANRLEVARKRGDSVRICQPKRATHVIKHNWMTARSKKTHRGSLVLVL